MANKRVNSTLASSNSPEVHGLGTYVRTHHRHYLQQSQYTVCVEGSRTDRNYASHERVLSDSNVTQDLLWKLVLPGSLRATALAYLHLHNITAFSLFDSDETLMEDLTIRQYVLRRRSQRAALQRWHRADAVSARLK